MTQAGELIGKEHAVYTQTVLKEPCERGISFWASVKPLQTQNLQGVFFSISLKLKPHWKVTWLIISWYKLFTNISNGACVHFKDWIYFFHPENTDYFSSVNSYKTHIDGDKHF